MHSVTSHLPSVEGQTQRVSSLSHTHTHTAPCTVLVLVLTLDPCPELNVQLKPIGSSIDGGAQVQQIINVECRAVFFTAPLLDIKFQYVWVCVLA